MKKLAFLILFILVGFLLLIVFFDKSASDNDKLTIVTTFYPPAEFASQIGKDKINVVNITSGGIEPHDFEPSPKDLVNIENADLFILNGQDFDHWAEELVDENEGINALNLSDYIKSDLPDNDPHFWLDPLYARELVGVISSKLIYIDQENREFYEINTSNYQGELIQLDEDYRSGLGNCSQRKIVVSHDAFSYVANRYSFEIINISGLSPEEEPTSKTLIDISNSVKENNIKYIFYETLVSPDLANTIANETSASTLVLNPLEGLTNQEVSEGENYVSIMRSNLDNLRIAMECQ